MSSLRERMRLRSTRLRREVTGGGRGLSNLHGIGIFTEIAKRHGVKLIVVGEPTVFSALPSPEVAETLGLSEANVKVRLQSARSALKKLLEPLMREQAL